MVSLPPGLFEVESMAATGRAVSLRSGSEIAKEEPRSEDDAVGSLYRMWSCGVPRSALAKGKSSSGESSCRVDSAPISRVGSGLGEREELLLSSSASSSCSLSARKALEKSLTCGKPMKSNIDEGIVIMRSPDGSRKGRNSTRWKAKSHVTLSHHDYICDRVQIRKADPSEPNTTKSHFNTPTWDRWNTKHRRKENIPTPTESYNPHN
jgi:hypothetical protein